MNLQTQAKTQQLQLFLALSRTPHVVIDLATPMAVALLCLGTFPPLSTIIIGLITVFAGYACIYALNDVTDFELDKQRMGELPKEPVCFDLDCMSVRHPLAQGLISFAGGAAWTVFWGIVALVGAALLNPVCAVIFVVGAILEIVYCKLYQHSQWKILIHGGTILEYNFYYIMFTFCVIISCNKSIVFIFKSNAQCQFKS